MLPFHMAFFAGDSLKEYNFFRNGRNRVKMALLKNLAVTPVNKVIILGALPTNPQVFKSADHSH